MCRVSGPDASVPACRDGQMAVCTKPASLGSARYDECVSGPHHIDDPPSETSAPMEGRVRRVGGVRSPTSEVVVFEDDDRRIEGWSLNMSRGGLRAILDVMVEMGEEFEITVGMDAEPRTGRIVWVREEKGGSIVGVAFLDTDGSVPPPPGEPPLGLTGPSL